MNTLLPAVSVLSTSEVLFVISVPASTKMWVHSVNVVQQAERSLAPSWVPSVSVSRGSKNRVDGTGYRQELNRCNQFSPQEPNSRTAVRTRFFSECRICFGTPNFAKCTTRAALSSPFNIFLTTPIQNHRRVFVEQDMQDLDLSPLRWWPDIQGRLSIVV